MADRKYYCLCDLGCKFETMTKEQILAAIEQAINEGKITNIDTGFVTKLKELNKGGYVTVWRGTTAEYNALTEKDENCIYIKTDDTRLSDIENAIANLIEETISNINTELVRLNDEKAPLEAIFLSDTDTDVDRLNATGIYCVKNGLNAPFELMHLEVREDRFAPIDESARAEDFRFYQKAVDIVNGTTAVRYTELRPPRFDGIEWEYENPPMEVGVEYRTTERHENKVVYVKKVDIGTVDFPTEEYSATVKDVYFSTKGVNVFSYECYIVDANNYYVYKFPFIQEGSIFAEVSVDKAQIHIMTFKPTTRTYTAYAILKYTKD